MSSGFSKPELLTASHNFESFDCGVEALDAFLKRHALKNQSNNSARTFVTMRDDRVVGYYSLCAGSVEHEQTPARIQKGLARHPVPVVLLARLAVDRSTQGAGLGFSLLQDVLARFMTVQETIGARALLAHAKDEKAKRFYEKWGFAASEDFPLHLYMLTKDVKATLGSS